MLQKTPVMDSVQNHLECHSNDNNQADNDMNSPGDIAIQDGVVQEEDLEIGNVEISEIDEPSKTSAFVILPEIPSDVQSSTTKKAISIEIDEDGEDSNKTVGCAEKDGLITEASTTNNALDIGNVPNDLKILNSLENQEFKLDLSHNEYSDQMCVQNIEDENLGRMVYGREPLSIIAEGNSPVAEVAPIIVINRNQVNLKYPKLDDNVKTSITKPRPERSSLKSEIILPSKSKIPCGVPGIKGVPGSNRLYLTGLKKSTSLTSQLSTADFSPRSYKFSEENCSYTDTYIDGGDISGVSTPMTILSEVADVRSKLSLFFHSYLIYRHRFS